MENYLETAYNYISNFGFNLIIAIIIMIVGKIAARVIANIIKRLMTMRNVEVTVSSFTTNLIYYILLAFVIIAALSRLGIETASFIAVLGAAGLAVGLALQGSLSNFASGVLIIIFKPFKIGDFVEMAGSKGVVSDIQIFNTTLKTPDNKVIIIPNSSITGSTITNYSKEDKRRIDFVFGIGYGDDIAKAKKIIAEVFNNEEKILKDPAFTIGVVEHGDSSVNLAARPWVKTSDYWDVYFRIMETIKVRFDQEGINIPFPQRDVHVYNH